jgi:hypothetical protein
MKTSELRKVIDLVEDVFGEVEVFIYTPDNNMINLPIISYFVDHINKRFALVLDTYIEESDEET